MDIFCLRDESSKTPTIFPIPTFSPRKSSKTPCRKDSRSPPSIRNYLTGSLTRRDNRPMVKPAV
jgi:hypothetical protein